MNRLLDDTAINIAVDVAEATRKGVLIGTLDGLTPVERSFVEETLAAGRTVHVLPARTVSAVRTADFLIDGVRWELKTLSGVTNTADKISAAIANRTMNERGQAGNVIIDARTQAGITKDIAERGAKRAFVADKVGKVKMIRILGPDFDILVPRM